MGLFGGGLAKKVLLGTARLTGKAIIGTTKVTLRAGGKSVGYFIPEGVKTHVGKVKPGRCEHCGKQLLTGKGGVVNGDNVHKRCLKDLVNSSVEKYEKAIQHGIEYDQRGQNIKGIRYESCGCNTNNLRHTPRCPAAPHEFMPGKKPNR